MKQDLLQILIPTYNRIDFLKKNIIMLDKYITELSLDKNVSIVICNNASTDKTKEVLDTLSADLKTKMYIYNNNENIGLEKNAIKVLEKATAEYVMYLGDDDYIQKNYLREVYDQINKNKNITCIIPSFVRVDVTGNLLRGGRRNNKKYFSPGYKSSSMVFFYGHQLSGLTFKRIGTIEAYLQNSYRNIYLFMYFVGFNAIRGVSCLIADFPVKVTIPGVEKKDWSYGKDGLANERFKNCHSLFKKKPIIRFYAEKNMFSSINRLFLTRYLRKGLPQFIDYNKSILFSKHISGLGKIYYVVFSLIYLLKNMRRRIMKDHKVN